MWSLNIPQVSKECAKFSKLYFEVLCFIEVAEFNNTVLRLCFSHLKSSYIKNVK